MASPLLTFGSIVDRSAPLLACEAFDEVQNAVLPVEVQWERLEWNSSAPLLARKAFDEVRNADLPIEVRLSLVT